MSRRACPILFGLTLALVAWILIGSLPAPAEKPLGDDGYYLHFMQSIAAGGVRFFPTLFEQWNATPQDQIFPNPLRVGFILLTVGWGELFGLTYRSLQTLSLASFLLLCVLNYAFARRRFGEPRALFIGVLVAFSPLLMGLSRLALADSCIALWMTTAVWLYLEVIEDPASRWKPVLFMLAFAGAVLVKEFAVVLVVPFVAFLLYERFVRGVAHDLRRHAAYFAIPGIVVAAVLLLAAGGLEPLGMTVRTVLLSPSTNRYAIRFGSGPWFRVVLDFLLLSPWPTLLAVGWFWITAARVRAGRYERESVYFAFVIAAMVLVLNFFTKNVRYAVVLEAPVRIFAVLLVGELLRSPRAARATIAAGAAVALLCFLDWQSFDLIWVQNEGYDPITRFLGRVRLLMP